MKITPFDTLPNATPLRTYKHMATCFDVTLHHIQSNHHLYLANSIQSNHHLYLANRVLRLTEYGRLNYYRVDYMLGF